MSDPTDSSTAWWGSTVLTAVVGAAVAAWKARATTAARRAEAEAAWQLQVVEHARAQDERIAHLEQRLDDRDAVIAQLRAELVRLQAAHIEAVTSLQRTQREIAEAHQDRDAWRDRAASLREELDRCKRAGRAGHTTR